MTVLDVLALCLATAYNLPIFLLSMRHDCQIVSGTNTMLFRAVVVFAVAESEILGIRHRITGTVFATNICMYCAGEHASFV